jgi:hypothetical protein
VEYNCSNPCSFLLFFQEGKFRRYDVPDVGEVFKQSGRTNSGTNGAVGHGEEEDGATAEQNASKVCPICSGSMPHISCWCDPCIFLFTEEDFMSISIKILHRPILISLTSDPY